MAQRKETKGPKKKIKVRDLKPKGYGIVLWFDPAVPS